MNTEGNSGTFFSEMTACSIRITLSKAITPIPISTSGSRFVGSVVWSPNLRQKPELTAPCARACVWMEFVSGIVTAASGQPYSAYIATTAPQPGGINGGETGAVIGTNASAIGGRVSFLPRNSFNLPGFTNLDFRISRGFTFRERYSFEIRGEAFNLFNSTIISQVNTNAYSLVNAGTGVCGGDANTWPGTAIAPRSELRQLHRRPCTGPGNCRIGMHAVQSF